MVNIRYDDKNDNTAVIVFARKYLKNDMFDSTNTTLLCENTQSPEKPIADEIIAIFNASGILDEAQYSIPVVISRRHRIKEQSKSLNTSFTNFDITEKIIM